MAAGARERRRPHYYDDPGFNDARWWLGREYEHEAEVMAMRRLLRGRRFGAAVDIGDRAAADGRHRTGVS